jgi:hypothetical protein
MLGPYENYAKCNDVWWRVITRDVHKAGHEVWVMEMEEALITISITHTSWSALCTSRVITRHHTSLHWA